MFEPETSIKRLCNVDYVLPNDEDWSPVYTVVTPDQNFSKFFSICSVVHPVFELSGSRKVQFKIIVK